MPAGLFEQYNNNSRDKETLQFKIKFRLKFFLTCVDSQFPTAVCLLALIIHELGLG